MSIQLSTAVRNARLDAIESTTGATAKLRILTGGQPGNCAAAETGTLLVSMTLPTDWMAAAAAGAKSLLGTWSGVAGATGAAGYFRITDNAGTTCHIQGSVTVTGGGGDIEIASSATITSGDTVAVSAFTLTDGGA